MTKQILIAAATAALALPAVASAQDVPDLQMFVNPDTGEVRLESDGVLRGIEVNSVLGALLPANLPFSSNGALSGYDSDGNVIQPPSGGIPPTPQPTFGSLSFSNFLAADANTFGVGDLNAPFYDFNQFGPVNLGRFIDVSLFSDLSDIDDDITGLSSFQVGDTAVDGTLTVIIPEPATAGVIGLAAVGFLARRRRA